MLLPALDLVGLEELLVVVEHESNPHATPAEFKAWREDSNRKDVGL
ncbi:MULTISPECIES: hypothetical protein [Paenarthrobacter]|uniref:Uncharacterized protein n=1 Tax=Paenarthrobacter ureafaciens TaxID=37931 RepID=A0AAX3EMY1_PAEUR|nr:MULTISPECIES: hypothetical protein [Paenarthrobacter]MDO5874490.1 hypothetical protein [Paenarthrobacter sp. SD-1]UYV93896.1 hypothetical protein NL395_04180 [Paenarthrobacter ureafaciens]UYV98422.1 hypothetical protein NL394_04120 [Paenarthrobacter ureafaciens]WIV29738.1 hypothetical protein QN084_15530 [Paenarthrobacter sp. R1]